MIKKITVLIFLPLQLLAQNTNQQKTLLESIQAIAKTTAVTGREDEASAFINTLFEKGICKKDKLGNLVITIGSGLPKRLFTTAIDEPGYVISQIQNDGYLRITPVGYGHQGNLFHQFLEGNEVKISTENGNQYGVATVPSSHYDGLRAVPEKSKSPFQWQEAFIDIGAASSKAVAEKGIRLLDPLTTNKKPTIIANRWIAAPAIASKAAIIALANVAQTLLQQQQFAGTVIIAFTSLELLNGKGLESVVHQYGPFDEVVMFNRFLNASINSTDEILVDKTIPYNIGIQKITKPIIAFRHPSTNQPEWGTNAKVYQVGLPSNYTATPAEMLAITSVEQLTKAWLHVVDDKDWTVVYSKSTNAKEPIEAFTSFNKEAILLAALIEKSGVYPNERPVHDLILTKLPKWAQPATDEKGNIVLTFGKGKQHIAFVAHMDEVGFVVDSIRNDGILVLKEIGGFFNWVWEGRSALVHVEDKDVNGVFEPRANYLQATKRFNNSPITVNAGFASYKAAVDAGVKEGVTAVTMPKKMVRLGNVKATARGFDDRVGCAALLLALENVDPNKLPFTVTFVWSVGEETGLVGSTFAEKYLQNVSVGYPIDTYVSADAPMESKIFGDCPLGSGAVIRVLESINFISRNNLHYLQDLAKKNTIKIQYGMTAGGTDGQGFLSYGIPSIPLSWPGRYSHSPIEVMDFNDMRSLIQLIQAIMKDTSKRYN
jgi:putative aminopeptidase FrvX